MYEPLLRVLDTKSLDSELAHFILLYISTLLNSALNSNLFSVITRFKELDGVRVIEMYLDHKNEFVKKCADDIHRNHFSMIDSDCLHNIEFDDRIYF